MRSHFPSAAMLVVSTAFASCGGKATRIDQTTGPAAGSANVAGSGMGYSGAGGAMGVAGAPASGAAGTLSQGGVVSAGGAGSMAAGGSSGATGGIGHGGAEAGFAGASGASGSTTSSARLPGWPMLGQGPDHANRASVNGPQSPHVKWKYQVWDPTMTLLDGRPPVVSAEGAIALGVHDQLFRFAPDGTVLSQMTLPVTGGYGLGFSVPAFGPDGALYVGIANGELMAFSPDNAPKWALQLGSALSALVVAGDGTIYVAEDGGALDAVSPDGALNWSLPLDGVSWGSPPGLGPDGTVYILTSGSSDAPSELHAFDPLTKLLWLDPLPTQQPIGVAVSGDGTIYACDWITLDPAVVSNTGKTKWIRDESFLDALALGQDGTLYAAEEGEVDGVKGDYLTALKPDSSILWQTPLPDGGGSVVIGADGTIYTGNYAVSGTGQVLWTADVEGGWLALGPDGTLYGFDGRQYLWAIGN